MLMVHIIKSTRTKKYCQNSIFNHEIFISDNPPKTKMINRWLLSRPTTPRHHFRNTVFFLNVSPTHLLVRCCIVAYWREDDFSSQHAAPSHIGCGCTILKIGGNVLPYQLRCSGKLLSDFDGTGSCIQIRMQRTYVTCSAKQLE